VRPLLRVLAVLSVLELVIVVAMLPVLSGPLTMVRVRREAPQPSAAG
jgi:hypothetical protein